LFAFGKRIILIFNNIICIIARFHSSISYHLFSILAFTQGQLDMTWAWTWTWTWTWTCGKEVDLKMNICKIRLKYRYSRYRQLVHVSKQ
jgi:opacity protein-like surface antigen